jgi:hypothetical protein
MHRITQPSTWAGIAAILQVAKVFAPQWAPVIDGIVMAAGGAAVVLNEKSTAK